MRELRSALGFLKELYEVRDLAAFQSHVVAALPKFIPSEITSYNEINPRARRNEYISVPVLPPECLPVFERHMGEHPLITHYHKTRDGRALRISDFLSQRQFRRLAIYNEFFRPLRLDRQMATTFPAPLHLVVGLAVGRSRRDFSERERRLLDLLRPHLIQAYRNAESVTRMREEQALTRRALDELSCGIVILTREGRARLANGRAMRMLTAYCDESLQRGGRLPQELQRWAGWQVATAAGLRSLESPRAPLVMERDGRNLVVRLIDGVDERLLLLEEQTIALSPHCLLRLGVTRREAEVLAWMIQGKTNAEIAAVLGTSPYTVINHVRHIFDKLGVKTRTAATAYVLNAVNTRDRA